MKKLLLFAILLAASNSVSAYVLPDDYYLTDSTGNDEIFLVPSETVELLLWYTGSEPIKSFDVEVYVTGPGTIWDGIIIPQPPAYDVLIPSPYGGDIELIGTCDDSFPTGISNPLAAIDFHCDGPGDVTLDLYDIGTFDPSWNQLSPVCHGMVIHQTIPEPATMILLGLGGLLIRTKK